MLSAARAQALKPLLDGFLARYDAAARVPFDPVVLPRRYRRAQDGEVSALLACSLAYGRVELFKPKLEALLAAMGESPAAFAAEFHPVRHRKVFEGFVIPEMLQNRILKNMPAADCVKAAGDKMRKLTA